jgi:transcriptional regulator with XRE-family HTH domain
MHTFGQIISDARKKAGMSQKELAASMKKENGAAISPQYLNDIEHDRRNPPGEFLIEQFAKVLGLPKDSLLVAAGLLPEDLRKIAAEKVGAAKYEHVADAVKLFRSKIKGK